MAEEELTEPDSSSSSEETQEVDESSPVEEEVSSSDTTEEVAEETETSLMDVVQDAMPKEEEEVAEAEETTSEEIKSETEIEEPVADPDDWSDVPFNKHPRFRKLIAEKNELKKLSEQYQGDSVQYGKIADFIAENNLTAEDAAEGFRLMAQLRNDPEQAYSLLQGHLNSIGELTGKTLPEDIQGRLDDGFLDEDGAKELSQARANLQREQTLREDSQKQAQVADKQTRQNKAQAQRQHLTKVVQDWEATTKNSDPDFSLKQDEINDRVAALVNERGRPVTSQEVLSIANDAYVTVNQRYKSRIPSRQPIRTSTGGKLGGTPKAEPATLREAIANAMSTGDAP
tara:strand:- start:1221 stop:2249 length:1029 start_codon:yes stop_codon:yes gene_type:complete